MRINTSLALMVLFCAGCTFFRQDEGVFKRIEQTSRIVQVRGGGDMEDVDKNLRFSTEVGVATKDPDEIKWVVDKISTDRVIPLLPQLGGLEDVVFVDARGKPLALVRLVEDGHRLRIMPCIRKGNGYIVPVTRPSVHDFHTLDSVEVWQFFYQRLPTISEGYFSHLRKRYKVLGDCLVSTNTLFWGESIPHPFPDSSCEVNAEQD